MFLKTYRSVYSQHIKVKFLDNISTSDFLNHTYKRSFWLDKIDTGCKTQKNP